MIETRRWPWVARQDWQDILFIHFPVPYYELRRLVPSPFEIDTYAGTGWISVVLFKACHSRLRYMPRALSYPPFHQMNLRTYVRFAGEAGVYFLSINTNARLVNLGGWLAYLPFQYADINMSKSAGTVNFAVTQSQSLTNHSRPLLTGKYHPYPTLYSPTPQSFAYFVLERYCIWLVAARKIMKAPILHSHWDIQNVDLSIKEAEGWPVSLSTASQVHYASFKSTVIHPFETFGKVSNS